MANWIFYTPPVESVPSVPPAPSFTGPANEVLATPDGSAGAVTLRKLVVADLPDVAGQRSFTLMMMGA